MAINLNRTFGSQAAASTPKSDERPKAEYWLNVGYESDVDEEDGSGKRFVSLATGIPLDTQETLPVNSRNRQYAFFNQARNELRDDLIAEAKKLAPGETMVVEGGPSGLTFQLRRVGGEVAAPTGDNPFARRAA